KDGSATDVMAPNKKILNNTDFLRTLARYQIPLNWHPNHPVKSLNAMRLLHAVKDKYRPRLSHALYRAYWIENLDISNPQVLLSIVKDTIGMTDAQFIVPLDVSLFSDAKLAKALSDATSEAVDRGLPGVPGFFIPENPSLQNKDSTPRLFWGQDRLHFLESVLAGHSIPQYRLTTSSPILKPKKLTMFWDFSSPWSYLGWTQVERINKIIGPMLILEHVPVLVGAMFKEIGTPNVPMLAMSATKRQYLGKDLQDWCDYWNDLPVNMETGEKLEPINLRFPDAFPIRSVLPLRVAIVAPETTNNVHFFLSFAITLFSVHAAWKNNQDISTAESLTKILTTAGFDASKILAKAESAEAKAQLRQNNERALKLGLCGVPSYVVGDERDSSQELEIVWGQDRLDVVLDALCGWKWREGVVGGAKI
ncbi:hypothetical protein HDU76_005429, partial [Blyttiomyces sp. JEL0837]